MRAIGLTIGLLGALAALALTVANAEEPQVRSLPRSVEGAGPIVLDGQQVEPLFAEEAPAHVAEWLAAGQAATCANELGAWLEGQAHHPHRAEAAFLRGYCAHEAGQHQLALDQLSRSALELPALTGLAAQSAAESAYALDSWSVAVDLTLLVPDRSVYAARSRFLRGRGLRRAGRELEAVGVLRDFIAAYPNASYIAGVELELARALDGIGQLEEAAALYQRVSARYPGSPEETAAQAELAPLLTRLPEDSRGRFASLDDTDLVARAEALFDRHQSEAVIELLSDQIDRLGLGTPLGCRAAFLVGKSYTKLRRHAESVPVYEAIAAAPCEEDLIVKSLYLAGRALWNVDRDADAAARFRSLYTAHGDHSYADDALLYEARIQRANGDTAGYLSLLEEQIHRFPEGDMLGDANWLLFENDFGAGRYDEAVAFADAIAARTGENTLYNRGRIAYFRARALELAGRPAEAADGYEAVARDVPLSYYALLAINRLEALDGDRGVRLVAALHEGSSAVVEGGIPIEPAQVADDENFTRGLLLLRLGLLDAARLEFDRLADAYPNQDTVLWLVSFLFDRAGAYHISHDIPRRRIESFLSAYPTPQTLEHWRIAYPTPFMGDVAEAAGARNLDVFLAYAIIREESGFNPRAESWANARGLMQLMMPTAESMASRVGIRRLRERDLFDAETAITLGTEYLSVLAARYDGHPILTIAGYNGGEGNVDRWIGENGQLPIDRFVEEIPYSQTRDYTKRVLMTYWIYRWLYGNDPVVTVSFSVPSPS